MSSRDDRIANLALTLKTSGLARSEVQARMMAEEMIGVEENVQKRYDEEHTKATEYLKTAKNLGQSRTKEQPVKDKNQDIVSSERIQLIPVENKNVSEMKTFEPIKSVVLPADEYMHQKKIELDEVHTDINFGKGTLKDLMMDQIHSDNHEIKNIEELKPSVEPENDLPDSNKDDNKPVKIMDELNVVEHHNQETVASETPVIEEPSLDKEKLQKMMEEDGPLEEHTREIKEKPKDTKPKEDYVENTVDLSNMFNYNKK